jgi:hypothetical protein
MKNVLPTHLSNRALELTVLRLARRERQATVELMTHLAEFDRRRLYREAGYSSLYVYCTDLLKLSNDEAYNRMKAARTIRKFPQTLDLLAEGSLNLTTVRLIAPHLTPENHDEVLRAACGTSLPQSRTCPPASARCRRRPHNRHCRRSRPASLACRRARRRRRRIRFRP